MLVIGKLNKLWFKTGGSVESSPVGGAIELGTSTLKLKTLDA